MSVEENREQEGTSTDIEGASPETIPEYFASRHGKASARIYANIASDPVIAEVTKRKKLNYREMLLVGGGVVGALDDRIQELEARDGSWRRLTGAINAPLLLSAPSSDSKDIDDKEPEIDPAETQWFLKYLTLRNVLGSLVVVISLAAGFFAWWNQDYRSMIDGSEKRAKKLAEEVLKKDQEIRTLQEQQRTQATEISSIEGLLKGVQDAKKKAENRVAKLESQRDKQAASTNAVSVDLAKELGDAKGAVAEFETKFANERVESKRWKKLAGQHEKTAKERSEQLAIADRRASEAVASKDKTVDAWNQLLFFLEQEKEPLGRNIQFKTKALEEQLKELERYSAGINGMRQSL